MFTIEFTNQTNKLSLVIEDNGNSVWAYLLSEENEFISDAFVFSPIQPLDVLNLEDIQNGNPPTLTKEYATEVAVKSDFQESDFEVVWSNAANDIAIIFNNSPIAAIYKDHKSGYSKSLIKTGGFGQPWCSDLYQKVFK